MPFEIRLNSGNATFTIWLYSLGLKLLSLSLFGLPFELYYNKLKMTIYCRYSVECKSNHLTPIWYEVLAFHWYVTLYINNRLSIKFNLWSAGNWDSQKLYCGTASTNNIYQSKNTEQWMTICWQKTCTLSLHATSYKPPEINIQLLET